MKKIIILFTMVFAVAMAMAQTGNVATIDQYGTNMGEITQEGNSNMGNIDQGTAFETVTNIPSTYHLSGAWIDQIGDGNNASIASQNDGSMYNSGNGNAGSIYQDGNINIALQVLSSHTSQRAKTSVRVAVEIDQIGNENEAHQSTRGNFGSYGIQQMWIDQIGANNYANQYSNGGMQSVMTVKQEGSNNGNALSADVAATGLSSPLSLLWGTLMHSANSGGINAGEVSSGTYTQYQNGRYSVAVIDVLGSNNKTTQAQEFTDWVASGANVAYIDIIGDENAVVQGQIGEASSSDIDIDGSGNIVASSQLGDSNIVDIDLVGGSMNCVVGVEQIGNGHSATVFQSGVSNFAKVIQR